MSVCFFFFLSFSLARSIVTDASCHDARIHKKQYKTMRERQTVLVFFADKGKGGGERKRAKGSLLHHTAGLFDDALRMGKSPAIADILETGIAHGSKQCLKHLVRH
jgi:hypothetical protein